MTCEYINATDLCAKIGVTKMTLHRWAKSDKVGLPKPLRINGIRFYPISEIESWLEGQRG